MSNENAWYKTGAEGEKDIKDFETDRAAKAGGIFRLWLPVGGSTLFTFLDTVGFFFKEHNYYRNGTWLNWETCIDDIGEEECPFCMSGIRTYYECVFSVIDHARYESKKTPGRFIENSKKLLVLRSTARKKIVRKKEQLDGNLLFAKFSTHRDDKKECNTGEDFEYIERLSREEVLAMSPREIMGKPVIPEQWILPFDYATLFHPKSREQLERIAGRVPAQGSGDAPSLGASSSTDEASPPDDGGEDAPSVQSLIN